MNAAKDLCDDEGCDHAGTPHVCISGPATAEPRWHWRNCRSIGLAVSLWPLDWCIKAERSDDVYGGSAHVSVGPLTIGLSYSIGAPDHLFGLSEVQAYNRACAYEQHAKLRAS